MMLIAINRIAVKVNKKKIYTHVNVYIKNLLTFEYIPHK